MSTTEDMFDFPSADMTLICPSCSVLNHPEAPRCRSCGTGFDAPAHTPAVPPTPPPAGYGGDAAPPPPEPPPPEPPSPADAFEAPDSAWQTFAASTDPQPSAAADSTWEVSPERPLTAAHPPEVRSPVSTPAPPEAIPVVGVAPNGLTPPPDTAWSDASLGAIRPRVADDAPFPEPAAVDHGSSEWTATADAFFGADAADANPDPFGAGPDWNTDGHSADEATPYPTADDTLVHALAEGVPAPLETAGTAAGPGVSGPPVGELVGPYGRSQALLGVMTVGRDPRNAIVLNDPSVSRVHCRLEARQGGIHVTDLRSTNGTWVNGRRIDEVDLTHGDRVLLGRTELVFHGFGMPAGDAGPAARAVAPAQDPSAVTPGPTTSNGSGTIPGAAEVPPDTATA
ncbi:MAG: FHA domain-containing protein [Acidimicrobiia bacterium]|nr:FHA domain-containing protein [Acidimicrobiia bacterium]